MIFKQQLQQRLVTFYALVDFLRQVFQKSGKNIRIVLKGKIKQNANRNGLRKKIQLKRIRKPQLLLSQDELMAIKENKYHCLFDKSQKHQKKET